MRKEKPIRKLADGRWFVPQEEVAKFQTVASKSKSTNKLPVGMSPPAAVVGGNNNTKKKKEKAPKEYVTNFFFFHI